MLFLIAYTLVRLLLETLFVGRRTDAQLRIEVWGSKISSVAPELDRLLPPYGTAQRLSLIHI